MQSWEMRCFPGLAGQQLVTPWQKLAGLYSTEHLPLSSWSAWRCHLTAVNTILCRVAGDHLQLKALFKGNTWWCLGSSCFPYFCVLCGACTPCSVPWQQGGMIGPAALHRQDCPLCCRELCIWGKNWGTNAVF